MPRNQVQHITVNSGATLTNSYFGIAGAQLVGVHIPGVNSCDIYPQAAAIWPTAPVSADFARLTNLAGSGDYTLSATSGSTVMLALSEHLHPFTACRMEFSAAQTDTRTVTLIQKV